MLTYKEYVRGEITITLRLRAGRNVADPQVQAKLSRTLPRWLQHQCRAYVKREKLGILFGSTLSIGWKMEEPYPFTTPSGSVVFVRDLVAGIPYFEDVQPEHVNLLGPNVDGKIGGVVRVALSGLVLPNGSKPTTGVITRGAGPLTSDDVSG